jgi:hypothetical protein
MRSRRRPARCFVDKPAEPRQDSQFASARTSSRSGRRTGSGRVGFRGLTIVDLRLPIEDWKRRGGAAEERRLRVVMTLAKWRKIGVSQRDFVSKPQVVPTKEALPGV